MASSAQTALHICVDHEHQETDMYCRTCAKPVCVKCVRDDHKEHDWDSMKNVARSLRVQTKQQELEFKSVSKSIVSGVTQHLDFFTKKSETEFAENCSELETTRHLLIKHVNVEIDKMKSKCEKSYKEKKETEKSIRDKVKTKEVRLNFLIQEMKTGSTDFTDFDLIEMHEEISTLIRELQNMDNIPSSLYDVLIYTKISSDLSDMKSFLGSVVKEQSSNTFVLRSEFKFSKGIVTKIQPIEDHQAWVGALGESFVKLIDTKGDVKRALDLRCTYVRDFAVDVGENVIYFCDRDDKCVKMIDTNEEITTVSSTAPFEPFSICLTRSGDCLVCLAEAEGTLDIGSSPYILRRITKTGILIRDIEINVEGTGSHYIYPCRLLELLNGTICISMSYYLTDDFDFSSIYCIDCEGKIKFNYGGKKRNLIVRDICADKRGNILLFDIRSDKVQVIDEKGVFIRHILVEKLSKPNSVALSDNNCWTGHFDGRIKVYKSTCD